ncbi:hypothetical protein [Deinococcus sp.]|uniref:hypothetical protein n=1 Tax=Deinococcus sp. TaxID=47478 RepID=UPI002869E07E|nr:hypothetical protein [Deinococcus sp.]
MIRRVLLTALCLLSTAQAATLPSQPILSGGCCPGALWTPDSRALLFLDGPPARASTGIYAVPSEGGPVTQRFSSVAFYSPALKWAVRPGTGEATTVERLSDGESFALPTRGGDVVWNRAETKVAYARSATSGNYDRRVTQVYVADVFRVPKAVTTVYGGGPIAWLDDRTLLLSGKTTAGTRDRDLFTLDVQSGARRTLRTALGFRSVQVSPDGRQVAYTVSFDSAARNGLWLQTTAGGTPRRLPEFGAYQWRDARRMLLIPLRTDGGPHVLRQYDTQANAWTTLGDLGDQVRQADWRVSPDGTRVSYLSARDGNVRVLRLP